MELVLISTSQERDGGTKLLVQFVQPLSVWCLWLQPSRWIMSRYVIKCGRVLLPPWLYIAYIGNGAIDQCRRNTSLTKVGSAYAYDESFCALLLELLVICLLPTCFQSMEQGSWLSIAIQQNTTAAICWASNRDLNVYGLVDRNIVSDAARTIWGNFDFLLLVINDLHVTPHGISLLCSLCANYGKGKCKSTNLKQIEPW